MADNVTLDPGSGGDTIAADDDGTAKHQYVKLEAGADGTQTKILAGGGTEDGALRVTVASDSTGVLSVDDGGGALTVDGSVTADTELTTADLDTGAGTDTRAVVGLVGSKSGGGALIPGDATAGLKVDLGADNDVTVTGSVTANAGTNLNTSTLALEAGGNLAAAATSLGVIDNAISGSEMQVDVVAALPAGTNNIGDVDVLSVPAPLSTTGGGTEATAHRVTIANDSTGVLSVDDNGSSLTVDYATTGSGTATGAVRVELPTNGTGVIATVGAVTAITNALPAGTNAIGKLAANSGVDIGDVDVTTVGTVTPGTAATSLGKAVDSAAGATDTGVAGLLVRDDALATLTPADGDYTHGRTNLRGAQWMQLDAAPTGSGVSVTNNIDVDETEDAIKASAGTLWGYYVANLSASTMFVKLYNDTVANVTVGTTAPLLTLPVPAGAAGHVALPHGIPFSAAITVAATTGIANSDTGAPSANDVVFNAFYT